MDKTQYDKTYTPSHILCHFHYGHLPEELQTVSAPFCNLAHEMDAQIEPCAELSAGLRKLLEAKDCFVRAYREMEQKRLQRNS